MPRKTPEERANLLEVLEREAPAFEVLHEHDRASQERWAGEIAMLQRRVDEVFVEIDLGGGDMIAVRSCLSETESVRLNELYQVWASVGTDVAAGRAPEVDPEQMTRNGYEIIALVTANPLITVEWLKMNPGRFSTDDAIGVIFGWMEWRQMEMARRARAVTAAATFRTESAGSELRGVSEVSQHKRSA